MIDSCLRFVCIFFVLGHVYLIPKAMQKRSEARKIVVLCLLRVTLRNQLAKHMKLRGSYVLSNGQGLHGLNGPDS